MKFNPSKNVSLPTAIMAALTATAFFWVSLNAPLGQPSSDSPLAHGIQQVPNNTGGVSPTAQKPESFAYYQSLVTNLTEPEVIRSTSLKIYNVFERLGNDKPKQVTGPSSINCKTTRVLEDSSGKIVGRWDIPDGIERCTVFVSQTGPSRYAVSVEGITALGIYRSISGETMLPSELTRERNRTVVRDFSQRVYAVLQATGSTFPEERFPVDCKTTTTLRDARVNARAGWGSAPDVIASCVVTRDPNGNIVVTVTGTPDADDLIYVQGKN
jgi:hypothetical protein